MNPNLPPPHGLNAVRPALVVGHSPSAAHVSCTMHHTLVEKRPHSDLSGSPHTPSALQARLMEPLMPAPQLSTRVVATFVSGHTPSSPHVGIGTTPQRPRRPVPQCVTSTLVHTPCRSQSAVMRPSKCSPHATSTCSRLSVAGNPLTAGHRRRSSPHAPAASLPQSPSSTAPHAPSAMQCRYWYPR